MNTSDRFGATSKDALLSDTANIAQFSGNQATYANSWMVSPGYYHVEASLPDMKVKIMKTTPSGIEEVVDDNSIADILPVYYNLQGIRVLHPERGIFIEVRGTKVRKVTIGSR
ncbi:MAG: hypothetical protein J6C44_05480 [Muribaculaceae bacterium]|nr:hypothetical protein [Muribaculaceae bacterium]